MSRPSTGFRRDWNAAQAQSAHFIIDRSGVVGQCRALTDVAWHMNKFSINYIGVGINCFSTAQGGANTTVLLGHKMDSIATLIGDLAFYFKFPIKKIERTSKTAVPSSDKDRGVGIHADFESTWCGRGSYWNGNKPDVRTKEFNTIIDDAAFYAQFGYFKNGCGNVILRGHLCKCWTTPGMAMSFVEMSFS